MSCSRPRNSRGSGLKGPRLGPQPYGKVRQTDRGRRS